MSDSTCVTSLGDRRCGRPVMGRGLCRDHYGAAYYKIRTGKTTWVKLAEAGLALLLPRERSGSFLERVASARLEPSGVEDIFDDDGGSCPRIFAGSEGGGVLLVGEAPNRGAHLSETEGDDPLMVGRLVDLCGLPQDAFARLFGRMNLLDSWPGRSETGEGDRFPLAEARRGWERIQMSGILSLFDRVVLLGRRAEAAVLGQEQPIPWFTWMRSTGGGETLETGSDGPKCDVWDERRVTYLTSAPHPSGTSRWWNDESNVAAARSFFRFLADGAIHRIGCETCWKVQPRFPKGPPRYQGDDGRWLYACDKWHDKDDLWRPDYPHSNLTTDQARERVGTVRTAYLNWLARRAALTPPTSVQ